MYREVAQRLTGCLKTDPAPSIRLQLPGPPFCLLRTKSTARRGRNLEFAPSRRLITTDLAFRAEHRPSRGTFRSCVKVSDDWPEGPRHYMSFNLHHRGAMPPGELQLVSISSPFSPVNCAFVKGRSSLTVEGVCAPSVAPKKKGDTSFLSMGGGGWAGGGRCGAGRWTTESKASTQDTVYKRSEPYATLWLFVW